MKLKLRARRGAFVVLTAIMMTSMVALCALAVDFARIAALKNELQLSADASAMAGGIQMLPNHNSATKWDSAYAYAHRNKAMQDTVTVDSIQFGNWNPGTVTFTQGGNPLDAIRVVVSRQSNGLFMSGMGIPMPRIKARATAWAAAPIGNDGCIKPWAVPYALLMERLNTYQGIQNTPANLSRPFTTTDYQTLMGMPVSARHFALHLGTGTLNDPVLDSLNISGNYQAVQLGKYWDSNTQTYASPGPINGAQAYRDNVSGSTCYGITVGDSLQTNQGLAGPQNTVDPLLVQGNPPVGICSQIRGWSDNTNMNSSTYGDCLDAQGNVGVDVVGMFYLCASGCNGASVVGVKMIASFKLEKVYPRNDPGNNGLFSVAELRGTFNTQATTGKVNYNAGASPVVKVILVQ